MSTSKSRVPSAPSVFPIVFMFSGPGFQHISKHTRFRMMFRAFSYHFCSEIAYFGHKMHALVCLKGVSARFGSQTLHFAPQKLHFAPPSDPLCLLNGSFFRKKGVLERPKAPYEIKAAFQNIFWSILKAILKPFGIQIVLSWGPDTHKKQAKTMIRMAKSMFWAYNAQYVKDM